MPYIATGFVVALASRAGISLVNVPAGQTEAGFAQPADREAVIVTLLATAFGISLLDISAPV